MWEKEAVIVHLISAGGRLFLGGGGETAFGGWEYFAERLATNHDNAVDVGHNNGIVPSLVEDRPAASREQPLGELASGLAVI